MINSERQFYQYNPTMPSLPERMDEQFVIMLRQIEQKYRHFNRHIQIRIQKWVEQLIHCDENLVWKKSRNLYMQLLYEMVQRKWVGAMFLRMPPSNGIPNLKESDFKMIMEEVRTHAKETISWKHNELTMKKVAEPRGDMGSSMNTPNCVTDRNFQQQKIFYHEASTIREVQDNEQNIDSFEPEELLLNQKTQYLCKLGLLLDRSKDNFRDNQEFKSIFSQLTNILGWQNEQRRENEESFELEVEQGIERNKLNLFQFGSPRGTTQMQYLKATLHL